MRAGTVQRLCDNRGPMPITSRKVLSILLLVAAAVAGAGVSYLRAQSTVQVQTATVYPTPRALPSLQLVNQDGQLVDESWLADGWSVLFFGFTHCPDVCPMTLGILKQVVASNADLPEADQARMIFVSVDPARDTPAAIKTYVEYFGPAFRGLTGSAAQIDTFARAASVAYFVGEPDENGQYPVDHSSALFVLNPRGQIAAVFTAPHSSEQIAADLRAIARLARRDRT